jgi:nucleotide-binding universal stress UspA family protein
VNRHFLVCTDGSRLALKGVREGVRLAKSVRGRITGVYVVALPPSAYGEHAAYYAGGFTPADFRRYTEDAARKALAKVSEAARDAGVRCVTRMVSDSHPWKGILRAARAAGCGTIVMASHGRSALGGLVLGSETARILAHSRLPVLVVR